MELYQYGLGNIKASVLHVYAEDGKVYRNLCFGDAFLMIKKGHVIFICQKQHKINALQREI